MLEGVQVQVPRFRLSGYLLHTAEKVMKSPEYGHMCDKATYLWQSIIWREGLKAKAKVNYGATISRFTLDLDRGILVTNNEAL